MLDTDLKTKFTKKANIVLVGYLNPEHIMWDRQTIKFVNAANVRFMEELVYKNDYKNSDIDYIIQDSELHETNLKFKIVFSKTVSEENANVEGNPLPAEAKTKLFKKAEKRWKVKIKFYTK